MRITRACTTAAAIGVLASTLATCASATATQGAFGGRPSDAPTLRSAGRFLLTEIAWKVTGDWARAWNHLYPAHQRVATRETFIRLERRTPFPAPLESLRVTGVRAALVSVAGVSRPLPGAAVTVAVELTWFGPRDPIRFTHTFHLVPVGGHWTWVLSPSRYRLYRAHARQGVS